MPPPQPRADRVRRREAGQSHRHAGQIEPHFGRIFLVEQVAGLRGISAHVMRHTLATRVYAKTGDVLLVKDALGHASVATTQIYTRVTADALRDMYVTAHPRAR